MCVVDCVCDMLWLAPAFPARIREINAVHARKVKSLMASVDSMRWD